MGLRRVGDLLSSPAGQNGFSLWVRHMYKVGDRATFTHANGRIETFTLRGVDEAHLQEVRLEAGGVTFRGFHYLPKSATYTAGTPVTCARGAVRVVDDSGVQIDPGSVSVTITPDVSHNNDPYNMIDAAVMVTHPTGTATAQKTFFPPSWTFTSVVQAVYDVVVRAFQAQEPLPNGRQTYDTAEGVQIAFVYDELALSGYDIETAFPAPGQTLNALHQPVLRP